MSNNTIVNTWVCGRSKGTVAKGHPLPRTKDVIYSYGLHFPMAKHLSIPCEQGTRKIIVLNPARCSPTTGRHQRLVRRNAEHLIPVYDVKPDLWNKITDEASLQQCVNETKEFFDGEKKREDRDKKMNKALEKARLFNASVGYLKTLNLPDEVFKAITRYKGRAIEVANMCQLMRCTYYTSSNMKRVLGICHSTWYKLSDARMQDVILDNIRNYTPEAMVTADKLRQAIKVNVAFLL